LGGEERREGCGGVKKRVRRRYGRLEVGGDVFPPKNKEMFGDGLRVVVER